MLRTGRGGEPVGALPAPVTPSRGPGDLHPASPGTLLLPEPLPRTGSR